MKIVLFSNLCVVLYFSMLMNYMFTLLKKQNTP